MSNYTKNTNFASKDSLLHGNPAKVVKGTEIDTEFNSIQTAIATKLDASGGTLTSGTISGGTISGITDLAVADGGTGASTAADARTNLGALSSVDPSYTGTLTGGTGIINIGSGQVYKDSSGNIGIGTNSPSNKLAVVENNASGAYQLYLENSNNSATPSYSGLSIKAPGETSYLNVYHTSNAGADTRAVINATGRALAFNTNGSERARIDSSGNLLVGTTTAGTDKVRFAAAGASANQLGLLSTDDASGNAFVVFRNSAGTGIGSVTRVTTTNAVVYNTTSDQRLKSNIENALPVLEKLMQVQVRQYDWTEGDLHQDYGFVAQELEPVLSGIVTKGKTEEDVWQLDYSRLTPHLVKAIQEQQAIIQTLTSVTQQLQADVAALKAA